MKNKPFGLQVNLRSTPLGIDRRDPVFSWCLPSMPEGTSSTQTHFRLQVFRGTAIVSKRLLVDLHWVPSSSNTCISIPAITRMLEDNQLYSWRVACRMGDMESDFSDAQVFSTYIGDAWTTVDGIWCANREAPFAFARQTFRCEKTHVEKVLAFPQIGLSHH